MKPVATQRSAGLSETRASATIRPPIAPPTKAISDRAMVQRIAIGDEQEFVRAEGTDHGVLLSGSADR